MYLRIHALAFGSGIPVFAIWGILILNHCGHRGKVKRCVYARRAKRGGHNGVYYGIWYGGEVRTSCMVWGIAIA